jgi:tetratricopeptide (TPR) repeat protein
MSRLADRSPRTVLEQRIRQQCMTFEEFVQHAETFARDNHVTGTLSLRHLQRLVSGKPVGALRPATARLLEQLLDAPIATLLAPPRTVAADDEDPTTELRQLLRAARRIDRSAITLLHEQLDVIRRLDRQLGAIVVRDELNAKIRQVHRLTSHSLAPGTREPLAGLLSEMHTLAGWQALDLGDVPGSWQHYEHSRSAAAQSNSVPHESHAAAEQAFVLIDAQETCDAVDLLDSARRRADASSPQILRAWLAAAHGEALAASGDQTASLHAFDQAAEFLPCELADQRPYVALDRVHLTRWRGHALARFGHPDAITVLTDALHQLDPSFVRAETALRIDLVTAHAAIGDHDEAREQADRARTLAETLGSARQRRRLQKLVTLSLGSSGSHGCASSRSPYGARQR